MSEALYILTVQAPRGDAEEIAGWIAGQWDAAPVELDRPGSGTVWLESYFASEPEAQLAGEVVVQRFGLPVEVRPCPDRDWATSWMEHFHAQRIGRRLWVCPPWIDDPPPMDDALRIVVNPGLSFGTGDHFTTRFCLAALERLFGGQPVERLLDLGCGSGILSIAAAGLGCPGVLGLDHDPLALGAAQENLDRNAGFCDGTVRLEQRELSEQAVEGSWPVITANLYDQLLIGIAPWLIPACTWRLVASGIRAFQADAVAEVFTACGARELERDSDHEWCGMVWDCAGED